MEVLTLVLNALPYIIIVLVLIGGVIATFKGEEHSLKNWLLYACSLAEKELGGKTGQLKLKYVWNLACAQFKFLTTFLSFDKFSEMVDNCLVDLRHLIETNNKIAKYIGSENNNNVKGDE